MQTLSMPYRGLLTGPHTDYLLQTRAMHDALPPVERCIYAALTFCEQLDEASASFDAVANIAARIAYQTDNDKLIIRIPTPTVAEPFPFQAVIAIPVFLAIALRGIGYAPAPEHNHEHRVNPHETDFPFQRLQPLT